MKVRKWLTGILTLMMLFSLTGCGAESKNASAAMDYAAPMEKAEIVTDSSTGETAGESLPEGRKWIMTIELDAETDDLDALLSGLNQKIFSLSGYVENQRIHNGAARNQYSSRSASMTIRIPAEQADGFVDHVSGVSNVISNHKQLEDITLTYVDTESRVKALQTEEARLLELMAQAETMADLLEIESRLTQVRYELERMTSQLKVYDNLVDYATIHLSVREVKEFTPVEEKTVWQRIGDGFMDSLETIGNVAVELFIAIMAGSPYLVLLAIVGGITALVIIKTTRKNNKKTKDTEKTE